MIPGVLASPSTDRPLGAPPAARVARAGVIVLLALAVCGAIAWVTLLSPLSLKRWDLYDPSQTITVREPTSFVVYEEFDGAETSAAPPAVFVSIRSIGGRKIDVTGRADDNAPETTTYHTLTFEGRSTAWFTIDRPGNYTVLAFPSGQGLPGTPGSTTTGPSTSTGRVTPTDLSRLPKVALGPVGVPTRLGTATGLVLLVVVPLVLAVALWFVGRRRWPTPELVAPTVDEQSVVAT